MKKRVIIYGTGSWMYKRYNFLRLNYDIVCFCDRSLENEKRIHDFFGERMDIIFPEDIKSYKYDYIVVASRSYAEIRDRLIRAGIPEHKIRSGMDEQAIWNRNKCFEFGKSNPDKTFCVISRGVNSTEPGLLAWLGDVLTGIRYCEERQYIPVVDLKNYWNNYLELYQLGKINAWENYFLQVSGEHSLEEVYKSKNVVFEDYYTMRLRQPDRYPIDRVLLDKEVRQYYHNLFYKYSDLTPQIKKRLDEEYCSLWKGKEGKCVCGVIIRGTDYRKGKTFLHAIQPEIDDIIHKIEDAIREWKIDYIYVHCEEERIIEKINEAFPGRVFSMPQQRYDSWSVDCKDIVGSIRFERENDAYLRGEEYLVSTLLVARCDCLISGISGAAVGAAILGDGFANEYIFDKGVYGIEDGAVMGTASGEPIIQKTEVSS